MRHQGVSAAGKAAIERPPRWFAVKWPLVALISFFGLLLMLICFACPLRDFVQEDGQDAVDELRVIGLHIFRQAEHFRKAALGDPLIEVVADLLALAG